MNITECSNCRRYAAVVDGRLHNIAVDGFTVTDERHVCGESDRRH